MSVAVMSRVWEHSKQKGSGLILLLALADFSNDEGISWPSIDTLAKKARITGRQAQNLIASLEASGELYAAKAVGRMNTSRYFIATGLGEETVRKTIKGEIFSGFKLTDADLKRCNLEKEKVKNSVKKGEIAISPDPLRSISDPSEESFVPNGTQDSARNPFPELDDPIADSKALDQFKERQALAKLAASLPVSEPGVLPARPADFTGATPEQQILRAAKRAKKESKPRPRDPVYDAIAAGSYNMTTIEGKSRYIGVMAAGVRDCTPEEYRATLADDLPKMYAWYKTAHPGISAPAKTETICKYLAEWRTATLASVSPPMFEEVRGPNPYNPNPNLSTLRMRS